MRRDTGRARRRADGGTAATPSTPPRRQALTSRSPDGVDDGTALALIVQGLTAWHLYRTCARMRPGESVVVLAAAGGVGSLAVQLGQPLIGAGRVIADGLERGQARAGAGARRRRRDRRRAGGPEGARCSRRTAARRSTSCSRWPAGRVRRVARALAPFGRLVAYGISLARAERGAQRPLHGHRAPSSASGSCTAWARREMIAEPLRSCSASPPAASSASSSGRPTRSARPRRAQVDLAERRTHRQAAARPVWLSCHPAVGPLL